MTDQHELCTCCGHYDDHLDSTYARCRTCYGLCPASGRCARRPFEVVKPVPTSWTIDGFTIEGYKVVDA